MSARPLARPYLMLVMATACWGIGTVLSKLALDRGLAPMVLLTVELAASCLWLLLVLTIIDRRLPLVPRTRDYARLVALGALNPALAYVLGLLGLTTVAASLAVLMWGIEPVLVTILAVVLLKERVPPSLLLLIGAAIAGAVLVLGRPGSTGDGRGVLLTIAAVTACALYTVLTRRLILDDGSLTVVLGQQVFALVLVVIGVVVVLAATGADALGSRPDLGALVLAIVSGVVYYGLAFACYVSGLRRVPAISAGAVLPLIPVWGLAAGFLAGDRLTGSQWLGAGVATTAVLFVGLLEARRSRGDPLVMPDLQRGQQERDD